MSDKSTVKAFVDNRISFTELMTEQLNKIRLSKKNTVPTSLKLNNIETMLIVQARMDDPQHACMIRINRTRCRKCLICCSVFWDWLE